MTKENDPKKMHKLSKKLDKMAVSATLEMAKLSRKLKAEGKDIISLSLGEPDFDTPNHIKDAANRAIANGITKYPPVSGFPDLKEAIIGKLQKQLGLTYEADQIVVSTGAKQSLMNLMLALLDEGDEVVLPSPFWVSYPEMIKLADGKIVQIDADISADYKISPEQLSAAITPKTKLLVYSSPSNPTGSIYTSAELTALAKVLEEHPQVYIISDEIYDLINFGEPHASMANIEALRERVIIVNGVSKSYAMTGWRIGYIAAPKEIAAACEKIQGQFTSGANSIAQKAAIAAIAGTQSPTEEMKAAFKERRNLVLSLLQACDSMKINKPKGAFYLFPDISGYFGKSDGDTTIHNAQDFCKYLLDKALVASVPGNAFGAPDCFRISFAASKQELEEACNRIIKALKNLN